ncbi:hypothetical protein BHE74_00003855 [Ensete ventricosum]|nr:hypothetical protein BHE74_00003855 [Ensete ventricosum]
MVRTIAFLPANPSFPHPLLRSFNTHSSFTYDDGSDVDPPAGAGRNRKLTGFIEPSRAAYEVGGALPRGRGKLMPSPVGRKRNLM